MKHYQCTHCDKESSNFSDFSDCKKKNHEIMVILDSEKKHTEYAKDIMQEYHFKTIRDTQETLYYENGVYKPGAETLVNSECESRIPNCTSYMRREVFKTIQASTYVERNQFDTDPIILNLKNGLFHLEKNEFHTHTPHYLSRIQLSVNYNRSVGPVKFIQFMMECLPDYHDRNTVIEEFASILLRNAIRLEKIFMYVGYGANGKSTFLFIIETLIGDDNISHVSIHDLINSRFSKSLLDGKIANVFADISNDELSKIGVLKAIVSGDPIAVEKKGKDHFTMKNDAKMFYSCNQLPEINEDTDAVFRRFIITEWNQQFLGDKDNKNLFYELTTEDELSGILNVLIHKARQILAQQKLSFEQSVDELRMGWIERANPIQRFAKERLEEKENSIAVKSEVYSAYIDWCKSNQIRPKNEGQFTKKLKSLGFSDDAQRVKHGVLDPKGKTTRIWISVSLVTQLHHSLPGKQIEKKILCMVDTSSCNNVTDVTKTMFVCKTCGAGPFGIDAVGTGGVKIRDFHEKQGHEIKQFVALD